MLLVIRVDRTGARRWLLELAERLGHEGHDCAYDVVEGCTKVPSAIDRLVDLERVLFRSSRAGGCERIDLSTDLAQSVDKPSPQAIIDLSSSVQHDSADQRPRLRVRSDGY